MIDEEIALVRATRPGDVPDDPEVKARAWARLHAEFGAEDTAGATSTTDATRVRRRSLRKRLMWRVAATGLVAAGAAGAIVVTQTGGGPGSSTKRPAVATAAQTLELAARTVEQQTAPPRPRPSQWVYAQTVSAFALTDGNVVGPEAMHHGKVKVEEWWRFDGKRMARSVQNGKLYVKGILGPGARPRHDGTDPRFNGGYIGGPGIVSRTPNKLYDYVAGLPTDPAALLARIRRDNGDKGQDVTTFGVIAGILRDDHLIPPKLNAALYRALGKIPRVSIKRDATDYAGRHGIGVAFDSPQRRNGKPNIQTIVLDRRTFRYMGDSQNAVLASAVVDDAGQRG